MKAVVTIAALMIGILAGPAGAEDQPAKPSDHPADSGGFCVQVISCGTKNGVVREYPTPCAARDDGATNVTPKSGPTCGDTK